MADTDHPEIYTTRMTVLNQMLKRYSDLVESTTSQWGDRSPAYRELDRRKDEYALSRGHETFERALNSISAAHWLIIANQTRR